VLTKVKVSSSTSLCLNLERNHSNISQTLRGIVFRLTNRLVTSYYPVLVSMYGYIIDLSYLFSLSISCKNVSVLIFEVSNHEVDVRLNYAHGII